MKKVLFIILLLIPFVVKAANVSITDVQEIEKKGQVEAKEDPTFDGLKITFNLKFVSLNDQISYDVTIKNNSQKDYEIDTGKAFSDGEYIEYNVTFDNDNKVIKAGETKHLTISLTYIKEVPADKLVDGKYTEKNDMQINLSNEEPNPLTSTGAPILLFILSLVFGFILIICYKNSKDLMYVFILLLLIPVTVLALEKLTLEVQTEIEITPSPKTVTIKYPVEGPICEYNTNDFVIANGMTWEEFFASNDDEVTELIEEYTKFTSFAFVDNNLDMCSNESFVEENDFSSIVECRESFINRNIELTDEILSSEFGHYSISDCKKR